MDAPESVWHSLNNCAGSLGGLSSLAMNDSYHGRMASTGSPTYMHTILLAFSFIPNLLSLSIAEIPLCMLSPATFQKVKVFQVHLYNQASTVLELLPRMSSISCLELTCNGNIKPFDCIIELPSVTSLTLQDGDSPDGLPMVWSLLHLTNLHKLLLCYEGNILSPAWPHLLSPNNGIMSFRLSYTDSVHDFDYHDDASIVLLRQLQNINTLNHMLPFFCIHLFVEICDNPKFLPCLVDIMFLCWDLQKETDIAFIADMLWCCRCTLECTSISRLRLHRSDPLSICKPITPGWESLLNNGLHMLFM